MISRQHDEGKKTHILLVKKRKYFSRDGTYTVSIMEEGINMVYLQRRRR
jgi:uncharacterized lipoprotein NlpE involved in copper resistance